MVKSSKNRRFLITSPVNPSRDREEAEIKPRLRLLTRAARMGWVERSRDREEAEIKTRLRLLTRAARMFINRSPLCFRYISNTYGNNRVSIT
jgi:hypothetical protein